MKEQSSLKPHCPVSTSDAGERVTLAHGEGGRMMRRLIRECIVPPLNNKLLSPQDDAAKLPEIHGSLCTTTDSFVITPLVFPGGDIGSLAVFGTVNDLAVSGARPMYLTLSLIIEEGLPLSLLERIVQSVSQAAALANVSIVCGDTKVVPRGAADGLFINTTGIGQLVEPSLPGPKALATGDELLVTGPIGCHGIAVLCTREELGFAPPPKSDLACLAAPAALLHQRLGARLKAMRDATRGGVAAVLHEWAEASGLTLTIDEQDLPVSSAVRGACELLGLDPLHVANEGTMVVAVESGAASEAIEVLRAVDLQACRIGSVAPRGVSPVTIQRILGARQALDDPLGAPLPRIC